MIGKIHNINNKKIFACCDLTLLDTELVLDDVKIKISSSFYGGEELDSKKIIDFFTECDQINIFGKKVCDVLLSKDLISKEQLMYIDDVPHIQIYKL